MSTTVSYKLNNDGVVIGLGLHDGYLCGITNEKGGTVKLLVESYKKEPYIILLEGVGTMNVINFWQGNLIFDVSLMPAETADQGMWVGLFKDRITTSEKIAEAIARNKKKYFFVLIPSYGAEIYATCDGMQIKANGASPES